MSDSVEVGAISASLVMDVSQWVGPLQDAVDQLSALSAQTASTMQQVGAQVQVVEQPISSVMEQIGTAASDAGDGVQAGMRTVIEALQAVAMETTASNQQMLAAFGQMESGVATQLGGVAEQLGSIQEAMKATAAATQAANDQMAESLRVAGQAFVEMGQEAAAGATQARESMVATGEAAAVGSAAAGASSAEGAFTRRGFRRQMDEIGFQADPIAPLMMGAMQVGLVTAPMVKVTEAAAKFQDEMGKVNTMLNLSKGDYDRMSESVRTMGADLGATAGPAESAAAMYHIVSMGFTDTKSANDLLRASLIASTAGWSDLTTTVNTIGGIMNAYGKSVGTAADVSDKLFQMVKLGNTDFNTLSQSIGPLTAIASEAGVGLDELGASLATLTDKGIAMPRAVTGVERIITSLVAPTSAAQKAMKHYGLTINETTLRQHGLIKTLGDIHHAVGDSSEAWKSLIPDIRAVTMAESLMGDGGVMVQKQLVAMGQSGGAAMQAATVRAKDATVQWDAFKSSIHAAAITIGQNFLPATSLGIGVLRDITQDFNNAGPVVQEFITWIGGAALGVTAFRVVAGLITTTMGFYRVAMGTAATATKAAGAAAVTATTEVEDLKVAEVAAGTGATTLADALGPIGIAIGAVELASQLGIDAMNNYTAKMEAEVDAGNRLNRTLEHYRTLLAEVATAQGQFRADMSVAGLAGAQATLLAERAQKQARLDEVNKELGPQPVALGEAGLAAQRADASYRAALTAERTQLVSNLEHIRISLNETTSALEFGKIAAKDAAEHHPKPHPHTPAPAAAGAGGTSATPSLPDLSVTASPVEKLRHLFNNLGTIDEALNKGGIDSFHPVDAANHCQDFVTFAYGLAGIKIPTGKHPWDGQAPGAHVADRWFSNDVSTRITDPFAAGALRPGDLLGYHYTDKYGQGAITHVNVYVGGGKALQVDGTPGHWHAKIEPVDTKHLIAAARPRELEGGLPGGDPIAAAARTADLKRKLLSAQGDPYKAQIEELKQKYRDDLATADTANVPYIKAVYSANWRKITDSHIRDMQDAEARVKTEEARAAGNTEKVQELQVKQQAVQQQRSYQQQYSEKLLSHQDYSKALLALEQETQQKITALRNAAQQKREELAKEAAAAEMKAQDDNLKQTMAVEQEKRKAHTISLTTQIDDDAKALDSFQGSLKAKEAGLQQYARLYQKWLQEQLTEQKGFGVKHLQQLQANLKAEEQASATHNVKMQIMTSTIQKQQKSKLDQERQDFEDFWDNVSSNALQALGNMLTSSQNFSQALKSVFQSLEQVVVQALEQIIQKMIEVKIEQIAIKMFPALFMHDGGVVAPVPGLTMHSGGMVERMHSGGGVGWSGLQPDETLRILQYGEMVLPKNFVQGMQGARAQAASPGASMPPSITVHMPGARFSTEMDVARFTQALRRQTAIQWNFARQSYRG